MKLDMHIHSTFSRDGTSSPEQIVARCKELGLDGFAITDHNAIQGSLKAVELAKQKGMVAICGVEISTVDGHVLAYGVHELISKGLSIRETVDKIHATGGLAVAAHPVRFPSGIGLDPAADQGFDAIEVLNGGNSRRGNANALKLARKLGRSVTAGSDAHKIEEVGKAYIELASASSEEDVLLAVRRGLTRVGGRSRTRVEGAVYSMETLIEWLRGNFRRL